VALVLNQRICMLILNLLGRFHLKNKKTFVISCAVLALDLKRVAKDMGMPIETEFLEAGLHERPALLREKLQVAIDKISAKPNCERIVIGYGFKRSRIENG
jgi:hypothetical protein